MRSTDIFNLDFTAPGSSATFELQNRLSEARFKVKEAVKLLEEAVSMDCREEEAWRLLASLYVGTDQIKTLNELESRHEKLFGAPMFAITHQPRFERDARRKLFDIPARITKGVLPPVEDFLAACAAHAGAMMDFSRVRGADPGGLQDLAQLFNRLPRDHTRPLMLAIERFINGLQKAAFSPSGTPGMWEVLFAYLRLTDNEPAFETLAVTYASKFGAPAPPY
ncbi:MAG TPA: hypothetical protein VLC55_00325 [Burkholderiales bacterium]|nr:hypothetical protein [Burkholderiales bacterium]